jgi:flagellar biosynthesis protein
MSDKNKDDRSKKAAALKYDIEEDNAPRIVANAKGDIAQKIIETAQEHNIPIRENQDLVDILVQLNIGEEIPPKLYEVIAEMLSFIYRLENRDI